MASRGGDLGLWGWDPTPGIVSVWAEAAGLALVWRRLPESGTLVREEERFRPWVLLDRLDDIQHVAERDDVTWRELEGPGALRYHVSSGDGRVLARAILEGASLRLG